MSVRPLVLRPPAKINLSLRVGKSRPDGFHELRTVFQSIAISDRLTLTPRRGPMTLETDSDAAPADPTNLVWRAAALLWRALGRRGAPHGVAMALQKRIPIAAGLGGGSADAAAALVGLHRLWTGGLGRADLVRLAAELGSDVPFFLVGGTAVGLARGEDLYPMADVPRLKVIVIAPSFGIATADAYRWLDEDRGGHGADALAPDTLDVRWPTGPVALVNDLQVPVARREVRIVEALQALRAAGARAAAMSGSGSAVFGVFADAALARAARRLQRPGWRLVATRTLSRREALTRMGIEQP